MAKRLTKQMIGTISKKASQKIGEAKLGALTTARSAIADKLYDQIIGGDVLAHLNSLPPQFTCSVNAVKVGIIRPNSDAQMQSENGVDFHDTTWLYFDQWRRGPVNAYQIHYAIYEANELFLQYKEVDDLINAHNQAINEARQKIYALLSSIRTVEKAIELWPEGKEHLEEYLGDSPMNLPAVAVNDVNAALTAIAA